MDETTKTETCPRCGGPLRRFPEDRGALSRSDNETIVCGPCGNDEATIWHGGEGTIGVLPSWAREFRDGVTRRQLLAVDRKPDA